SDRDAYAAAKEVYRAYVAASNRVDLADPATFHEVFHLTKGELNTADRLTLKAMHAKGTVRTGAVVVQSIALPDISDARDEIVLHVCLNVEAVDVLDAAGASIVAPDRRPVQNLKVSFRPRFTYSLELAPVLIQSGEGVLTCR